MDAFDEYDNDEIETNEDLAREELYDDKGVMDEEFSLKARRLEESYESSESERLHRAWLISEIENNIEREAYPYRKGGWAYDCPVCGVYLFEHDRQEQSRAILVNRALAHVESGCVVEGQDEEEE